MLKLYRYVPIKSNSNLNHFNDVNVRIKFT